MHIDIVNDPVVWTRFVETYQPNTLLQSWNWLLFSQKQGYKVFPLGLFVDDRLVGLALFSQVESRRGNYLVAHGAPMIDWQHKNAFEIFHKYLIELSKKQKVDFFRIRPPINHTKEGLEPFLGLGYKQAPMYFPAEHTLLLDLTQSEEALLKNMRKQTRYYVRQAEKTGVEVRISTDRSDVDILYELYQKTVERQDFVPYGRQYFVDQFDIFAKDGLVELFIGYHQGNPISAAMVIYCGSTAYYLHGASVRAEPDVYASYAVQWAAIRQSRTRGMKIYDFWGVAPTDDRKHPRAGLTLFKRGFGGERIRWMHTLDYPISWRYWPMYAYVKYERWKRGL